MNPYWHLNTALRSAIVCEMLEVWKARNEARDVQRRALEPAMRVAYSTLAQVNAQHLIRLRRIWRIAKESA